MPARKPLPPRRTTGRRVARPSLAARLIGGSTAFLSLIGAPIVARPVLSGGIAGVAVLFAFVSGNAFYSQPSRHPRPMMATRGEMPMLASDAAADEGLMAVPLVLEVQTLLARTGHYTAALDGKPGKATAAAIRAFQTEYALRVDGEPSTQLLRQINAHLQVADAAPAVPVAAPAPERFASIEPGDASDPAPTGSTGAAASASPERDLVRKIQSGLTHADVAKLDADGIPGERTREAIRTFEALEGLDVTGNPDKRILERLISIGAVQ
jgi:peptidoglycan hydrolase-like protein with peptidoglycan-binding domain